jgi:hypothetical protein
MKQLFIIFLSFFTNDYICQPNYWKQFEVNKSDFVYISPKIPNENYVSKETIYINKYVYDPKELKRLECLNCKFFYQYKKCILNIK